MKVRILSGNLAGQIVEQTAGEAENSISSGSAEAVKDEPEPAEAPETDKSEEHDEPEPDEPEDALNEPDPEKPEPTEPPASAPVPPPRAGKQKPKSGKP